MEYKGKQIVYIEYQDGKPVDVSIAELDKWSLEHFDFEPDCNDEGYFMHYNSGSGGFATEYKHLPMQMVVKRDAVSGCTQKLN